MKISIVTASYNQGPYIENCIQSVLNQNFANFEHIIIDNCSTDKTLAILQKYPHLKWVSEPDDGQSDALNKGFRRATGDIIGWLNTDEVYHTNAFKAVTEYFVQQPTLDVLYGDIHFVDKEMKLLRTKREVTFDQRMLLYYGCYIATAATFFRRNIFDDGNFLDVNYHYVMDFEYFVRLVEKGYIFAHIEQTLSSFLWTGENKSLDSAKRRHERVRVQRKYGYKYQAINDVLAQIYHLKHTAKKVLGGKIDQ